MNQKDKQLLGKLILAIAIILLALSFLFPWGEITLGILGASDFYTWGIQTSSLISESPTTTFYWDLLSPDSIFVEYVQDYLIHVFLTIVMLPLNLIALGLAIIGVTRYQKNGRDLSLRAGIISLITIFIFVIAVNFGLLNAFEGLSPYYEWSAGLFIGIFSVILFFTSYFISSSD